MTKDAIGSLRGLERLDQAYKKARTDAERRLITIKRACFMARLSRVPEAQAHLKAAMPDKVAYEPLLNGWVLFCEGLIEHFDSLGATALSKFRRAHAVSLSIGNRELAAISSAWIASTEFAASNIDGFAGPLNRAFDFAEAENFPALTRACILVADALSWSGNHAAAKPWYRRAWRHAVDDADFPMQIVALHNEAAYQVAHSVVLDCLGLPCEDLVRSASVCLDSAGSLDVGIGRNRLTSIIPLLRAELHSVQGRWDESIALFDVFLVDSSVEPAARQFPKCVAQRGYCKAQLGDLGGALVDIESALEGAAVCCDMDDLYVLHARSAQVLRMGGRVGDAVAHDAIALRCHASFEADQANISRQLLPLVERLEAHPPSWLNK